MSYAPLPKEEIELFKQLPDLQIIFDVGSRDDTEYYDIYPGAEFHLFEPNPAFVESLKKKVGQCPNVHINQVGVGNVEDALPYSNDVQAFRGGEATVVQTHASYPVTTLDRYVSENAIHRIDFLKIDVEGYDFKVLLGAHNAISMTRFLQYEHWDDRKQFHAMLGEQFDMEYVGYRNVLCMNKELVDLRTRNRIREYIGDNDLKKLA